MTVIMLVDSKTFGSIAYLMLIDCADSDEKCNSNSARMFTGVKSSTVHDDMLHTDLRPCLLQHLQSASCHQLFIPHHWHSVCYWAFCTAGPMAYELLLVTLCDSTRSFDSFRSDLKTYLFSVYMHVQCIRGVVTVRCELTLMLTWIQYWL